MATATKAKLAKPKPHWTATLKKIGACSDAVKWAKDFKSAQAAWDACDDPEWMMWALGECDDSEAGSPSRRKYVAIACANARLVLHNFEKRFPNDMRPREAIELCQRYADGENISLDELRLAVASAWSAAASAGSAADSARNAVYSAGRAADSGERAADSAFSAADSAMNAVYSARSAADSARNAVYSARSAADSARNAVRKQCCDHIRKEFPKPPRPGRPC